MDEEDARQAYLDQLDGLVDIAFLQPFTAELETYALGAFSACVLTTSALRSVRTAERIAQDQYDLICIQYAAVGYATGDADGQPVESTPGTVLILDYGRPFSIIDTEPRTVVNVTIPRTAFPGWRQPHADWHGVVLTDSAAGLLAGFMRELSVHLPTSSAESGPVLAGAFIALLTAALGSGNAIT